MNHTKELNLADVSEKQLEEIGHALRLPRKSRPSRNYFNCSADEMQVGIIWLRKGL